MRFCEVELLPIMIFVPRGDGSLDQAIHDVRLGRNVEASFRALFEDFYSPVVRFFRHKGIAEEECRDLAQDVFVVVYRNLKDLRDEAHFRPWLFAIARNVFKNHLTAMNTWKRKHTNVSCSSNPETDSPQDDIPDTAKDALERALDGELVSLLRRAILSLPEQMSRCVVLRVVNDLTYEEIATQMGISIGAVKAHLHRAKKDLREKLGEHFRDFDM